MDPTDVISTATQAALNSVEQASTQENTWSKSYGTPDSSTRKQQRSAPTMQHDKASRTNGVRITRSSARNGNSSSLERDNANHVDQDDDEEAEEDSLQDIEAGEMSFVIDTAGDMDVDREVALEDETRMGQVETHIEGGLLLPTHVNLISQSGNSIDHAGASSTAPFHDETTTNNPNHDDIEDENLEGDMGDFEQLDMDPSTANRYYGAEEKAERRAKEQCLGCGELGHDRRHCPHQHCLACGAMDEHPTRFCPLSTSCFRCGCMGHQTRTCPKPRRGPRSEECERCGSYTHVKTLCPTLWRVYTYSILDDYDRHRAKAFFKLQSEPLSRGMEPDPAELSDSEDDFVRAGQPEAPASQFDPATRWCYNCSGSGNHWGDDCPEPRVNPTRGTGEPSAFSEFVSRLGPFAKLLPGAPPLAGFQMPCSQFTFSVGSSATMHVSNEAMPSSSSSSRNNFNGSGGHNDSRRGGRDHASAGLAIGKHVLSSPQSSRTSSPRPGSLKATSGLNGEKLVSFDRTKAIACPGGGFLTLKEKKKGKTPLPEHLFRQWVRDRHDYPEHAGEIRSALEKRAELEAKGSDTRSVPSTKDIVGANANRKGGRGISDRPNKKSKGNTFHDPITLDIDYDSDDDNDGDYDRDSDYSDSDSNAGGGGGKWRRKRKGDGKNNFSRKGGPSDGRKGGSRKRELHTGWGHHGDDASASASGSGNRNGKGYKGSRFSTKRSGGGGGGDSYRPDHNGGSGSASGGRRGKRGGRSSKNSNGANSSGGGGCGGAGRSKKNTGGGGGAEKIRGGGSKYRGGYF
ncbi:uncharacterized protein MEPE_00493 [Melanopsichium pennsylvanicum]|uniref:CCHC-type domain-containing protein n=2 Tax=Melanopsichium pennsylvanicum TaxID=63383 RepID=A0AAJ4XIJ1_9BASI|nr:mrna-nucleus export-related protein [Melanopsichium pennsylvanicum 4]SNX81788.1 uncharacterized protein MEPE_00493 [Melanopsichium pennsylvanicum]